MLIDAFTSPFSRERIERALNYHFAIWRLSIGYGAIDSRLDEPLEMYSVSLLLERDYWDGND